MSKPTVHAQNNVSRWGGVVADYEPIHEFLDMSKAADARMTHRMMLHHSMGPYVCQRVFGSTIRNSDGRIVSVRDIAEQHIIDDLGYIPSFADWTAQLNMVGWMAGSRAKILPRSTLVD